jgi:ubiquinol-cytochrome c reductase cytochrome b subunit
MGTVPGGDPLKTLIQGGSQYGNYTITHFYAIHVFVLPILLGGLLVAHIYLFRRHGVTYPDLPADELERKKTVFIPNQLLLDVLAMTVTGTALVLVTFSTHGADLFAPAQPASNFVARPEWYFLFLFQLLKYFEGPLSIVATVILPGAATVFLLALPWIDRAQSRRPKERMPALAAIGLGMGAVVALTVVAMAEDAANESYQEGLKEAHAEAEEARKWAKLGVLPEGGDAAFRNDPAYQKKALFAEHCETCHTIDGVGGDEAPELTDYSSRAWIRELIRNPNVDKYFGQTPHDVMEPYPEEDLPDPKLDAIVEFVVSLMGDERMNVDEALAAKGKTEFDEEQDCSTCHMLEPGEDGDGPDLNGHGSQAWVERVIRDSSKEDLFGEAAKMPKFEGKLSDEEITMLAELVVSQRYDEQEEPEGDAEASE